MKTRTWKIESEGWQGRAGTPLPAATRRGLRALPLRLCVSAVMLWFGLLVSQAQTYSIDWHKIAGGGGTSTGGVYAITGTIGQPDATANNAMTGGNYSLTGGFWALISVVQTPGLPNLFISHSGTSVIVSWPDPASNSYTLQQNSNLANPGGWTTSGYAISWADGTNRITLNPPTGNLFFRLKQ